MGELKKRMAVAAVGIPLVLLVLTNYTACCFLLLTAVLLGYREYRGMVLLMMELATGKEDSEFVRNLQSAPSVFLAQLLMPLYCIITHRDGLSQLPWSLLTGLLIQAAVLFTLRTLQYKGIKAELSTPEKPEEHYLLPKYRILAFQATCYDFAFMVFVSLSLTSALQILLLQARTKVLFLWFTATWQTDNGCLVFGKLFGTRKVAQFMGNSKTVEGIVGGYALCWGSLLGCNLLLYDLVIPGLQFTQVGIAAVMFSTTAVVGDLGHSFIKQAAHTKNTPELPLGHRGLLDRMNSLCLGCPVAWVLVKAFEIS